MGKVTKEKDRPVLKKPYCDLYRGLNIIEKENARAVKIF